MSRLPLVAALALLVAGTVSAGRLFAQEELFDRIGSSTKKAVRPPRTNGAEPPRVTTMRALRSKAEFKVAIMSLENFATFLSKKYHVPVKFDWPGLKRAGVRPDAPISADIADMPLSAALTQILGRLRLAHRVEGGVILITDRRPDRQLIQQPIARARRVIMRNGVAIMINDPQPFAMAQNVERQALQQLRPLLQVELLFAKRTCGATGDQMKKIKAELDTHVESAAAELLAMQQNADERQASACSTARKLVQQKLTALVEAHLPSDKAALYRGELHKRNSNEREVSALKLVALLDRQLLLSAAQRESLRTALSAKWDDGWTPIVEMSVSVPAIPDDLIEPQLDPAQIKVWQAMPKLSNVNWGFQIFRNGWFGMPVAEPDNE